jgi:hypothetical protein
MRDNLAHPLFPGRSVVFILVNRIETKKPGEYVGVASLKTHSVEGNKIGADCRR